MSSHYIYISCQNCGKSESLYTGDISSEDFDDADWEGEFVRVPKCLSCKEASGVAKATDDSTNTESSES